MASPVVESQQSTADETSPLTATLPSGIVSGNTLIAIVGLQSVSSVTWPSGWTQFFSDGLTDAEVIGAWRKADGTEGSTIDITIPVSKGVAQIYRISGAADPTSTAPEAATANGNSTNPDAPNLAPTGGSDDYLWIATAARRFLATITGPSGYTSTSYIYSTSGADSVALAWGYTTSTASSENPGAFSSASAYWGAATIAVYPSAAAHTASGTPSIALPTASGTAKVAKKATGTPSTALPTATGAATRTAKASGTPSVSAVTSSGAATRTVTGSDGNPATSPVTSAGSATRTAKSSGAPSLSLVTTTGAALRVVKSSGTPEAPLPTATGAASVEGATYASGSPSTPVPTASGSATRASLASGTPQTASPASSGTAVKAISSSGASQTASATATGSAVRGVPASGSVQTSVPTASGAALRAAIATASISISIPTTSGSAKRAALASGTPETPLPTATGHDPVTGSGSTEIALLTAYGTALVSSYRRSTFGDYSPTNDNATTYPSQYDVSDQSGFRVEAGQLKKRWDGNMVRNNSREFEYRHSQDLIRAKKLEQPKKARSPEPDDEDVGDITQGDL